MPVARLRRAVITLAGANSSPRETKVPRNAGSGAISIPIMRQRWQPLSRCGRCLNLGWPRVVENPELDEEAEVVGSYPFADDPVTLEVHDVNKSCILHLMHIRFTRRMAPQLGIDD